MGANSRYPFKRGTNSRATARQQRHMTMKTDSDYLKMLDAISAPSDENPADPLSEAEQAALDSPAPPLRADGKPVGSVTSVRKLTSNQLAFVAAKTAGKTNIEAYREAYPNDTSNDRALSASAYRLTKHPVISKMLEEAWGETIEHLSDDAVATKRYVLKSLLSMAQGAKQESSRLKALELMGKASGLFTVKEEDTTKQAPSAAQLKKELSGHLQLINSKGAI